MCAVKHIANLELRRFNASVDRNPHELCATASRSMIISKFEMLPDSAMLWLTVLYVPHDTRIVVFIPAEDTDYYAQFFMNVPFFLNWICGEFENLNQTEYVSLPTT